MTDDKPRPLHVQVAEALDPASVVEATPKRPRTVHGCKVTSGTWIDSGELSTWGTRCTDVPNYPNDPSSLWPLIVRYKISVRWVIHTWQVDSDEGGAATYTYHPTDPAIAVCELLVALGKAGKLKP